MARILGILALTACAHTSALNEAARRACTDADDRVAVERCAGLVLDITYGMTPLRPELDDPAIVDYVASVGQRLVRASGDRYPWRFHVLDDTEVEAYSSLGSIYVTRGLLALLRDEAELAGVLGHEIGHGLAGHSDQLHAESAGDLSRDDELQADALAVSLAARAGYDPRAVVTAMRAIAGTGPGPDGNGTHPTWETRLPQIRAFAGRLPAGELAGERFRTRLAGLPFGDDPRNAAVVGGAVVFGRARLAVDLPPGFRVADASGTVALQTAGAELAILRIAPDFAKFLTPTDDATGRITTYVRGDRAFMLVATGTAASHAVDAIVARFRDARPGELAQLHPTLVNFAAPRALR